MQPLSSRRSFLGSLGLFVRVVPVRARPCTWCAYRNSPHRPARQFGLRADDHRFQKRGWLLRREAGRADVEILVREWESNSRYPRVCHG